VIGVDAVCGNRHLEGVHPGPFFAATGAIMSGTLTPTDRRDEEWDVPDGYELIDGRLVEMPMGTESAFVGGEIHRRLANHCVSGNLGWALPSDAGYRCFSNRPRLLRKPDVSFVRRGRFPGDRPPRGDSPIAPDLVVEVVSHNDLAEAVQEKVSDYLAAGVRLVWVVYPTTRLAVVYRPGGTATWVTEHGELDGEDVVSGFRCRLADVLLPAEPRTDAEPGPEAPGE
jgi:Uma2 family endonuclease